MNRIKRLIACVCLLTMLLTVVALPQASASSNRWQRGDVDDDLRITIKDATIIQKHLANLVIISDKATIMLADADCDNEITIKDATTVQKYAARLIINLPYLSFKIKCIAFTADYNSGMAMPGVPVTFTVDARSTQPDDKLTYEFYVDGELIGERTDSPKFTYTFEDIGHYRVSAKIYSEYANVSSDFNYITLTNNHDGRYRDHYYKVVKPYDTSYLDIKSFYYNCNEIGIEDYAGFDDKAPVFVAEAMGGSGEYEYAFVFDSSSNDRIELPICQDFSSDNTFVLNRPEQGFEGDLFTCTVYVRDKSEPNEVVSELIHVKRDRFD